MKLFAFAQFSCAVHQSFEKQLNVGKRHQAFVTLSTYGAYLMRFTLPLIALAAIAAPAFASEEVVDVRISYADLDLTTEAGRAALESRVAAKLRKACTIDAAGRFALGRTQRDADCIAQGLAVAKVEAERVAALQQRRGREVAAN
jgi:UrcA family protein